MAQLFGVLMLVMPAVHPAAVPVPTVIVPSVLPVVAHHDALPAGAGLTQLVAVVYFTESAKYASSAVTRLDRKSIGLDSNDATIAYAVFCIEMTARIRMITITINR